MIARGAYRPRAVWGAALVVVLAAGLLTVAGQHGGHAATQAPPALIPTPVDRTGDVGGRFALTPASRIRYDGASAGTARTLAEDLATRTGRSVPLVAGTDRSRRGDIVLRADGTGLGEEGYHLSTGTTARVRGGTQTGVYYGTRTLLQQLGESGTAAAETIRDVPRYRDRGVALCPCALKVSLPSIQRVIAEMGHLKLNYLLLPLKVASERQPKINQWAYYTPQEARRIAAYARKHHVRVVPEINAPGHMEPFLFDRPDLQLTDVDGNASPARIDITKPEAFEFYTSLVDEYAAIFATGEQDPVWHLGADEYMISSSYERFPQLAEYARSRFGPDARPEDAFVDFVNRVERYVRSKHGMRMRIWNDGIPRRNVVAEPGSPHPRLDRRITVEHWKPAELSPKELIDAGYAVTNAASSLYEDSGGRVSGHQLCPDAARLVDCLPVLWTDGWTPGAFEDGSRVAADHPRLTGAHLSLWQSAPTAETEVELERRIDAALRLVAERTWAPATTTESYADFERRVDQVGHAPAWRDPAVESSVQEGGYAVLSGAGPARGRLSADGERAGARLIRGGRDTTWQLNATDDGYYRLTESGTGLCAEGAESGVADLLESAPAVGSTPTLRACDPQRATQKWQLLPDGGTGYHVLNAIHQLPMTVAGDGTVQLHPGDRVEPERWRLERRSGITMDLELPELLKPGQANRAIVAVTNHEDGPSTGLDVGLTVPDGWRAEPDGGVPESSLAPGETAEAAYDVTPPADATPDRDHRLTADATYRHGGTTVRTSRGALARIDPIACPAPEAPRPVPDDEFDGDALDGCRWTAVQDPDPEALRVAGGQLRIDTRPGDLAGTTNKIENLLLQPAPEGDWSLELAMTAPLAERYQQAGLIVHGSDDDYVEYVLVSDSAPGEAPRFYLSLVSEIDGEFGQGGTVNVIDPPMPADGTLRLRLTRSGSEFAAASSVDGRTWTPMPETVTHPALGETSVGLFATGPGQTRPVTVAFDRFRVRRPG